ncbi:MAG TPA: hypothetical protein VM578_01105 [Candidatus Saccharimonadales bacterium]|nr:hypothetical protein [Candidatus Saccharimonadales bacterium]
MALVAVGPASGSTTAEACSAQDDYRASYKKSRALPGSAMDNKEDNG